MYSFDPHEWEPHYRRVASPVSKQVNRLLDRFGESLRDWLHAALNWPLVDWRADLETLVTHTRETGLVIAPESLAQIELLLDARAKGDLPLANSNAMPSRERPKVVQLAEVTSPEDQHSDASVSYADDESDSTLVDGLEVAGPGPETTQSFKNKVRAALEIIDPEMSRWWHGPSVSGLIRSRNATGPRWNVISFVKNDRPIIVVDQSYTAGQTAQAIVDEVTNGMFATSIGVHFRRYKVVRDLNEKEFQAWRKSALKEAAAYASTLAEVYYSSLASITPAGDLIVTIHDVVENGLSWQQLLSALPLVDRLPGAINSVTFKLDLGNKVVIDGPMLREIKALGKAGIDKVAKAVKSSKTPEEAVAKLRVSLAKSGKSTKSSRSTRPKTKSKQKKSAVSAGSRAAQTHHAISAKVYRALEEHANLRGKYRYRDPRFELNAIEYDAHHGYQSWHIEVDKEVVRWIARHDRATPKQFEAWLRQRYSKPDLSWRFSNKL